MCTFHFLQEQCWYEPSRHLNFAIRRRRILLGFQRGPRQLVGEERSWRRWRNLNQMNRLKLRLTWQMIQQNLACTQQREVSVFLGTGKMTVKSKSKVAIDDRVTWSRLLRYLCIKQFHLKFGGKRFNKSLWPGANIWNCRLVISCYGGNALLKEAFPCCHQQALIHLLSFTCLLHPFHR